MLHSILEKYPLEQRDRAFLMRLVEGTVERCIEVDYVIDRYSKLPGLRKAEAYGKGDPAAGGIPESGTMDQCADAQRGVRKRSGWKLACNQFHLIPLKGFVNGVLRNVVRFYEATPYPKAKDEVRHLSVWYSMPESDRNPFY